MKLKNIIVGIVVYLLPCFNSFSQNGFEITVGSLNEDVLRSIVETPQGNFVMVGTKHNDYSYATEINGYIVEISSKGEIIQEKDFLLSDTLLSISDIHINHNGGYYAFGSLGLADSGYTHLVVFMEIDSEFNITKKHCYEIPENRKSPGGFVFKNSKDNFVYYGYVRLNSSTKFGKYPVLMEISASGELIREKYFVEGNDTELMDIFDIIEKPNNKGYFALTNFFPDPENLQHGQVINLDNNFNLISHIYIPEYVWNAGTLKWFSDSSYILSGSKNQDLHLKAQDNDIGLMILDTLGNLINKKYIGKPDTTDFPGLFSNFDYSADGSSIYVAGIQGFIFNTFPSSISKIILTKLDKDLNIIWEKFYGGDAYYIVQAIKATSDNGCMVVSTRYDYKTQNYEEDVHILKVNSDGNNNIITSLEKDPILNFTELIVYPNPGSFELNIRTAFQRLGGMFYLFDISGTQILQANIYDINTKLNTENLRSGTYIYKYIDKNKVLESGKWIKN